MIPKLPTEQLEPIVSANVPVVFVFVALLIAAALVLERYLLLTFFGSSFFRQVVAGKRA